MKKMFSYAAQASAGAATTTLKPTKTACLTLFHFEKDSMVYNLIQNAQVNLQHCIDGYDKSVMLKEDFNSEWTSVSWDWIRMIFNPAPCPPKGELRLIIH